MNTHFALDQEAKIRAKNYRKSESALLEILIEIEEKKAFVVLGYASMHVYCTKALELSDSHAYALIAIARKSREVPELKESIDKGKLNVSNARRIVSVLNTENQEEWISKAETLSQRDLERAVVKAHPQAFPKEKIRPLTAEKSQMTVVIGLELEKKLKRISDLLSQKSRKPVAISEALEVMAEEFLEKHDPVRKAKRNLCPGKVRTKHRIASRDHGQCTFRYKDGTRCEQGRWLEVHHRLPKSMGGSDDVENLITLCQAHHRYLHHEMIPLGFKQINPPGNARAS